MNQALLKHDAHRLVQHILQPSFLACATGSLHCCRRIRVQWQESWLRRQTRTNGRDRLPCSYLYRSKHWITRATEPQRPGRPCFGANFFFNQLVISSHVCLSFDT